MTLETSFGAPRLVELLSGVDAISASSRTVMSAEFFKKLLDLKELAGESEIPLSQFQISGEHFEVPNYSWGKYPVFMEHEFGRLGFSKSERLPGIRLQIRAKYLHAVGAFEALNWFTQILHEVDIYPLWTLSRLDLFADVQGWFLRPSDKERFLCRASDLTSRESNNDFTGFEFGRRKTGTINARIYDKTLELQKKPNGWTLEQWGTQFQREEPVWRVEFEFHTTLLRQVGITTADQGLASAGEIWAYATDKWLSFRDEGQDSNRSRWPISAEWDKIQNASLRGTAVAIERIREREKETSLERLIPPFHGYLTSIGAKLGATDLRSCFELAFDVVRRAEESGRVSTLEKLAYKKRIFAT